MFLMTVCHVFGQVHFKELLSTSLIRGMASFQKVNVLYHTGCKRGSTEYKVIYYQGNRREIMWKCLNYPEIHSVCRSVVISQYRGIPLLYRGRLIMMCSDFKGGGGGGRGGIILFDLHISFCMSLY